MPSITSFQGVGQVEPDPVAQSNVEVTRVITRWLRVSTRMSQVLSGADMTTYLDALSTEQEADLRALWPSIQQIDAILDAPADIADLPAEE